MILSLAHERKRRSRRAVLRALQASGSYGGLPDPVETAREEGEAFGAALCVQMDADLLARKRADPSLAFDLHGYMDAYRALAGTIHKTAVAKHLAGRPLDECAAFQVGAKAVIVFRARTIIGSMIEGLREDGEPMQDFGPVIDALPDMIFPSAAPA